MLLILQHVNAQIVQEFVQLCERAAIQVLCEILDHLLSVVAHLLSLGLVQLVESRSGVDHDFMIDLFVDRVLVLGRRAQYLVNLGVVVILADLVIDADVLRG